MKNICDFNLWKNSSWHSFWVAQCYVIIFLLIGSGFMANPFPNPDQVVPVILKQMNLWDFPSLHVRKDGQGS
jgi:hypothetical protein